MPKTTMRGTRATLPRMVPQEAMHKARAPPQHVLKKVAHGYFEILNQVRELVFSLLIFL